MNNVYVSLLYILAINVFGLKNQDALKELYIIIVSCSTLIIELSFTLVNQVTVYLVQKQTQNYSYVAYSTSSTQKKNPMIFRKNRCEGQTDFFRFVTLLRQT